MSAARPMECLIEFIIVIIIILLRLKMIMLEWGVFFFSHILRLCATLSLYQCAKRTVESTKMKFAIDKYSPTLYCKILLSNLYRQGELTNTFAHLRSPFLYITMASSKSFIPQLRLDTRASQNTLLSTGFWIETHDLFCIGTATLLPLPLWNSASSGNNPLIGVWENIRPEIFQLPKKRKMSFSTLKLMHRKLLGKKPPKALTILISSIAKTNDKWVLFIDDLLSLLLCIRIIDWDIEIIDPQINGKATVPNLGSDPIIQVEWFEKKRW